jgi:mono/diheme cytochrome c family protein
MTIRHAPLIALSVAALALATRAGDATEHAMTAVPFLPLYQQECASCHIAYPPELLPAVSWQRLLGTLSHHFGTDASVGPAVAAELSAWLSSHSAQHSATAAPPPEDRVTRSSWFVREHDEVPRNTWQRASIGSAANCAACHRDAARGRFDEHSITIPK